MPAKDARSSARRTPAAAAAPGSASDALRKEAERRWADADRKAAKGRRRSQTRVKQQVEARERDAELTRLKAKLAQSDRIAGRKGK